MSHKRRSVAGSIANRCNRGDCGKTFESQAALKNHTDLHDNNLQVCYFCPWRSPPGKTENICTHFDQHLDHRRFECQSCDQKFFRKGEMDHHFEAVHEKPIGKYKCLICNFTTHSRTSMRNHKFLKHK